MKKSVLSIAFLVALLPFMLHAADVPRLRLATTTSTENSGLLDYLLPQFEHDTGIKVSVIAVGTGAALQLGRDGNVDVVMVHARSEEDRFVAEGHGVYRHDLMYNDFVLLGPDADPARVNGLTSAKNAFARMYAAGVLFFSRGDNSGTHIKERQIWQAAGLSAAQRPWYREVGQGMEQTMRMASEQQGYVLADRGTWLAARKGLRLKILCQNDPLLHNPYGVIAVNPERHQGAQYNTARTFIDWLVSPRGQGLIKSFTIDGEQLFYPSAR